MTPQERLVETIRRTAAWRRQKGVEFADDDRARRKSFRAASAQRTLANFVAGLAEDDPDITVFRNSEVAGEGTYLALCREGLVMLSRFGMEQGAWDARSKPSEAQMRNVLRRVNGAEQAARHRAKET